MDYVKHYHLLVAKAKGRVLEGYVEVHHVIPRCMGGTDDKENLVQFTPEEHYVAHQLLHKIYPKERGLAFAVVAMTGNVTGQRRNKLYGWLRRSAGKFSSDFMSEMYKNPDYKAKHSASMKKLRDDPEYVARVAAALSKAHTGRQKSEQERLNIAEAGRKRERRVFSEEARKNMSEARRKTWAERKANGTASLIGQKTAETRRKNGTYEFTEEHRRNIGESAKGRPAPNKGKKHSQEARQKMSESAKRRCARQNGVDGEWA